MVSPVFDAQESGEFESTITELKSRLNDLGDGGVFVTPDTRDHESTLQSVHQRLDGLQGDATPESQDNYTGEKK